MAVLSGRHILLGVSGGIAAYKSPDLVRRLREAGAEVQVVMTRAATEFVTPLTFQAVSGHPVRTSLLDPAAEAAMGHIELARWADAVLIAPASADLMARLAHGLADDLLTTVCLATEAPLAVAPTMNRVMWQHAATRANLDLLLRRGVAVFGPGEGDQACGETGSGRMLEPGELVAHVEGWLTEPVLQGCRVLITAGPTREAVDPVRFLGNRSSGKMGFALAAAAANAGAEVVLVAGPVNLPTPPGVRRLDVESAAEMLEAVRAEVADSQVFIACAAVADYRAAEPASAKIKKSRETLELRLERTVDILGEVAARERPPFTVGFAAETENIREYAEDKRRRKGLDMVVANRVGQPGSGFEADSNAVWVRWSDGEETLGPADKSALAASLVRLIGRRYHETVEKA